VALVGCSVQNKYKTLSFFFDGVPDPNAPITLVVTPDSSGSSDSTRIPKKYQHKPFAEQKCLECHTADKKQLVMLQADLCVKCHQNQPNQYAAMHAPVTAGKCMWCHDAHESDQPHLLKTTASELCLQCHDREFLPVHPPEHLSDKANCLSCHVGHGGLKGSMLIADNPQVHAVPLSALPSPARESNDALLESARRRPMTAVAKYAVLARRVGGCDHGLFPRLPGNG